MSALSISPPFPIFTDIDGQPLENGYIWIGTTNLNPIVNPINVYWDASLTVAAVQPIRTLAGYPSNSGTPARLYVNSDYSIQVQNRNGSVVYSAPAATEEFGNLINASQVVYDPAGTGAVATTVQAKLRESVSVLDFGAVGDGVTDDTAAIQAAIDSLGTGGGVIGFPYSASGYLYTTVAIKNSNITLNFNNSIGLGRINLIPQTLVTSGRLTGLDYPSTWENAGVPKPMDGDFNTMMYEETSASRLKNIKITGLRVTSANTAVPIYAYSVDGLTITDCDLQPAGQSAARIFHCSAINLKNNVFGGTGTYTVFGYKSRDIKVLGNSFISTTSQRALSFKGAMHISGQTIFENASVSGTTYQYFDCIVSNNKFTGGIDGVFWDTTPTYTNDAATDAGIAVPLGFTSGAWFGRGSYFMLSDNQFYLSAADFTASEGRAFWASAPHKNITVEDNNIFAGQIYCYGVVPLVVRGNTLRFSEQVNAAIFVGADTPSSTTMEDFVIESNVIYDYDAIGAASAGAIGVIGYRGVIKNNTGFGIGTWSGVASGLVVLNATSDEIHIEGNKLFKDGGSQSVLVSGAQNTHGKKFNNDTHNIATQTFTSDGYVEGTFTPVLEGSTAAGAGTYTVQVGRYTRIGNRCLFNIQMTWTAHTGTGNMRITGFPFSSDSTANNNATFSILSNNLTYGAGTLSGYLTTGGTTFTVVLMATAAAYSAVAMDTAGNWIVTGSYEIND